MATPYSGYLKLFDMLETIYPLMSVSVLSKCGYIG